MSKSLQEMKLVPQEMLQARIVTVKSLKETDLEGYEVVKDQETSEHYLHYCYIHKNLAVDGETETYNHLMPLDSDDVVSIVLNEQPFAYPDHWTRPFMRNGPEGHYVWFDPAIAFKAEEDLAKAAELTELLLNFKKTGNLDQKELQKLLNDIDQIWDKKNGD